MVRDKPGPLSALEYSFYFSFQLSYNFPILFWTYKFEQEKILFTNFRKFSTTVSLKSPTRDLIPLPHPLTDLFSPPTIGSCSWSAANTTWRWTISCPSPLTFHPAAPATQFPPTPNLPSASFSCYPQLPHSRPSSSPYSFLPLHPTQASSHELNYTIFSVLYNRCMHDSIWRLC